jgi:hypothetical protein
MPQTIIKVNASFTQAKNRFVNDLNSFSEKGLSATGANGGWNPVQICEHVITSEYGTLNYMKKKILGGWESLELTGASNSKAASQLHDSLISDKRWTAPAVLPEPLGQTDLDELLDNWTALRVKYDVFLDKLPVEFYDRLLFKHPYAGRLNLWQTMDFLTHHIYHHMHQLDRVKIEMKMG